MLNNIFFLISVEQLSIVAGNFLTGNGFSNPLLDELKKLKDDPAFADGILVCQGKEIPIHRFVFGIRSDVFKKMFASKNFLEGIISSLIGRSSMTSPFFCQSLFYETCPPKKHSQFRSYCRLCEPFPC